MSEVGMLAKMFSFKGRTGRLGYFLVALVQAAVLLIGAIALTASNPKSGGPAAVAGLAIFFLALFAFAWVGLAATVRRLRDMGWNLIVGLLAVMFVPFAGALLLAWPGDGKGDFDAGVFSDEPDDLIKTKAARRAAKEAQPDRLAWMRPAPKAVAPMPAAYVTPPQQPTYAPNSARATFGLRR